MAFTVPASTALQLQIKARRINKWLEAKEKFPACVNQRLIASYRSAAMSSICSVDTYVLCCFRFSLFFFSYFFFFFFLFFFLLLLPLFLVALQQRRHCQLTINRLDQTVVRNQLSPKASHSAELSNFVPNQRWSFILFLFFFIPTFYCALTIELSSIWWVIGSKSMISSFHWSAAVNSPTVPIADDIQW